MNQVVFGLDQSSNEELFEEDYKEIFSDSAGCPSWLEAPRGLRLIDKHSNTSTTQGGRQGSPRGQGMRHYPDAPQAAGDFATVVFGAGKNPPRPVDVEGAAGHASWVTSQKGLGTTVGQHFRQQAKLRERARGFLERARKQLRGSPKAEEEIPSWAKRSGRRSKACPV